MRFWRKNEEKQWTKYHLIQHKNELQTMEINHEYSTHKNQQKLKPFPSQTQAIYT